MYVCDRCGTPWKNGSRWCGACRAPIASSQWVSHLPPAVTPLVPSGPAAQLEPAASLSPARRRPDQVERIAVPKPEFSRWRKGPTTFGPVGRIASTVAIALVGAWLARDSVIYLWAVAYVPVALLLLWAVWRKDNVDGSTAPGPWRASYEETKASFRESYERRFKGLRPETPTHTGLRCARCTAMLPVAARWCPECNAPITHAEFVQSDADRRRAAVGTMRPPREIRSEPVETSRWRKTETTMGPLGRVAATVVVVGLVVAGYPLAVQLSWSTIMAAVVTVSDAQRGGAYLLVAVPLLLAALLAIWRPGRLPRREEEPAPAERLHRDQPRRAWSMDAPRTRFTRWERTDTTFGPVTKIAITAVVVVGVTVMVPPMFWPLAALPAGIILFDLWRKGQINEDG